MIPVRVTKPALFVAGWLSLCGSQWVTATEHHLELELQSSLTHVIVRGRFEGQSRLRAGDATGDGLRLLPDCSGQRRRGQTLVPGEGGCVAYRHPLSRDRGSAHGATFSSPSQWLWLPPLSSGDRVLVTVRKPPRVGFFPSWQRLAEDQFVIHPSPRSTAALAVFGRFQVAQARGLEVALIGVSDTAKILEWLRVAMRDVSGVGGRFPNPEAKVIVVASEGNNWGNSPVPFGHVVRNGVETVRFFVNETASLDALVGDWTATHEFAHLLLPYIRGEQKWISEGFASYYQNVLLARRGAYSERDMWRRFVRSFASARETWWAPSPNDAHERSFWQMRMLIYWSGAALAMMGDIELRRATQGQQSLDDVLAQLAECCLPSEHRWSGQDFFRKLDQFAQVPVFESLYLRYADADGLPPIEDYYADLGLEIAGSQVRLNDQAPLAALRRAITRSADGLH